MSTMPVRLSVDGYDEICALWNIAGLPTRPVGRDSRLAFETQLGSGNQVAFGLRDAQNQLIRVVLATHDSRKGWINRLTIHPNYQQQGFAGQLIETCEAHFKQLGIPITAALVEAENAASLALFQREGYHLHRDVFYLSKRENHDA
jgi:ribosomal protein S18 acetylase RimI-like enzyme